MVTYLSVEMIGTGPMQMITENLTLYDVFLLRQTNREMRRNSRLDTSVSNDGLQKNDFHIRAACYHAAKGHVDVLVYLFDMGHKLGINVLFFAAYFGNLDTLKYLLARERPQDYALCEMMNLYPTEEWPLNMEENEIFSLVHKKFSPTDVLVAAAASGELACLREAVIWFGPKAKDCRDIFAYASTKGDMVMINWLEQEEYSRDIKSYKYAARRGRQDVLDFFQNKHHDRDPLIERIVARMVVETGTPLSEFTQFHNCPWDEEIFAEAMYCGDLQLLTWLKSNGCPWDKNTFTVASQRGDLQLMIWLKSHGCPWDYTCCNQALERGHIEALKWLVDQGCPLDKSIVFIMLKELYIQAIEILMHRIDIRPRDLYIEAAKKGRTDVIILLKNNGYEWISTMYMEAAKNKRYNVTKWLRDNRFPWAPGAINSDATVKK